ncbi:hypothetical protein WAI453_007302 [Rhynchosporium graminicola]
MNFSILEVPSRCRVLHGLAQGQPNGNFEPILAVAGQFHPANPVSCFPSADFCHCHKAIKPMASLKAFEMNKKHSNKQHIFTPLVQ